MRTVNFDQNVKRDHSGPYAERDHGLENGEGEVRGDWSPGGGEGREKNVGGAKRGAEAAAAHVEVYLRGEVGGFSEHIRVHGGVKKATGRGEGEGEEVAVEEAAAVERDQGEEKRTDFAVAGAKDEG